MNAIESMASRLPGTGAVSLRARRAGRLDVVAGTVWVTRGGTDAADHVLRAGQTLAVRRGDRLVVERWRRGECVEIRFSADAMAWSNPRAVVRAVQAVQLRLRRLLWPAARGRAAGSATSCV